MRIYNTLAKRVETFKPSSRKSVKMYTCGPTVYARPHIGNFRTYVFEDALKRYLIYQGFGVRHVMNITDIDNTVMKEARKTGIPRAALTAKYERLFRKDAAALGIIPAGKYPHVSGYTERMAGLIGRLMKKGRAYSQDGCKVYFDISKFPSYGKLVGKKIRGSTQVTREEYKPFQAGDFLLWSKCAQIRREKCFKTHLGIGRPAWNVQCATMATTELGDNIDISMGGQDNLFNHHENTRAIADSLCGHEFSRYYVHVRHLILDGKKMSKSKGNVVLLPDLLSRGFSARESRMMLLSVHYRKRLDFTWEYARGIKLRFLALKKAINRLRASRGEGRDGFAAFAADARKEFESSLDNNMDIPSALVVAEKFARECADADLSSKQSVAALALLRKFDAVLACLPV